MKTLFSCIHFPIFSQNNDFILFYTGKLYGLTGMLGPSVLFRFFHWTKSQAALQQFNSVPGCHWLGVAEPEVAAWHQWQCQMHCRGQNCHPMLSLPDALQRTRNTDIGTGRTAIRCTAGNMAIWHWHWRNCHLVQSPFLSAANWHVLHSVLVTPTSP